MNSLQRLEVLSVEILSEYIGIAGEFIVADVIRKSKLLPDTTLNIAVVEQIFLSHLAIALPSNLPVDSILDLIRTKLKGFLS